MASFNRAILLGNLTRDPELRHTSNGTPVCDLGLAVNRNRPPKDGGTEPEADFFDVTLWARTAEIAAEYLAKGRPVLIEGRLQLDRWESEGQKRSKIKVIGERMQLLGGGAGGATGELPRESRNSKPPETQSKAAAPQGEDEVPF